MHRFAILVLLIQIFIVNNINAQTDDMKVSSREVLVSHHDSLERARIAVKTPKKKIRNAKKFYYWFYSGHIICNQGAYNENPLNGHYFVYNKAKQLITKGYFHNGKKGKTWMYWYADGTLKRTERWRWGYQWGKTKTFNEKGEKLTKYHFRKGIQTGKQRYYQGDSVIVKHFKKGKEVPVVIKKETKNDTCFIKKTWKKIFSKKKKDTRTAEEKKADKAEKKRLAEANKETVKPKLTKEEKDAQKEQKRKEKEEKKRKKENNNNTSEPKQ